MKYHIAFFLIASLGIACGDDDGSPIDTGVDTTAEDVGADTAPQDAGVDAPEEDVPPVDELDLSQFACAWEGPYGAVEGATMRPVPADTDGFQLQDCSGETFLFPDAAACESKLTVVSIAAEWCGPCYEETRQFNEVINEAYDIEDVRLIQAITQTIDFDPSTTELCERWKAGNRAPYDWDELKHDVIIDPAQLLGAFFPTNELPATIIVDPSGEILHYETGVSAGLVSLTSAIDRLLAERE